MKAHLRSARIAPKKANIIAKMVRGMPVGEAMDALRHTHKKGARMVEQLLQSAMANAEHNDKQNARDLVIKSIVVNQGLGYQRGVPKARGSVRPMTKFLSHISVTLGLAEEKAQRTQKGGKAHASPASSKSSASSAASSSSQKSKTPVQKKPSKKNSDTETSNSSASAASTDASDASLSSDSTPSS